jgi:hypothetical protein
MVTGEAAASPPHLRAQGEDDAAAVRGALGFT